MENMILIRDINTNNIINIEHYLDMELFINEVIFKLKKYKNDFIQLEIYYDNEYICDIICPYKSTQEAIRYFCFQYSKFISNRIQNYYKNENNIR